MKVGGGSCASGVSIARRYMRYRLHARDPATLRVAMPAAELISRNPALASLLPTERGSFKVSAVRDAHRCGERVIR